ncbi:RIP metalloprotease RseP [Primorskyibacter flagellatus]|uniref:RIP metalloprotease RseP n=1 Tax=Primorskyibacter flagellatus TaxID=1387277 RepID=UPI003A8E7CB3
MAGLIPQFGSVFLTLAAFVVALSIIVAIHEYGHYIVGRWSGISADVFSLGFGPVIWSRVDKRGTLWQIAALPLGGYVKFRGDANPSGGTDTDAMDLLSAEDRRQTMNGAPLWARTATVAAGPIFNFILSIVVFMGVFMARGVVTEPLTVGELRNLPVEQQLLPGDVILEVGSETAPSFDDPAAFETFMKSLPAQAQIDYTVRRDGEVVQAQGPYPYPAIATQVVPQSAAYDIEMKAGDVIRRVDDAPIYAFEQLKQIVEGSNGRPLQLDVWRDGEDLDFVLVPRRVDEPQPDNSFKTNWRIGIAGGLFFEPAVSTPGPIDALNASVAQTWGIITGSLSGLYHMVTGAISSCNLSGPLGIAQASGAMASQGTTSFIWFIAVLSTAVGLMNLFPIPVLDGGHLVFYAYEAITGRQPNDKALRILMTMGLAFILSIMVFGLTNDLFCP